MLTDGELLQRLIKLSTHTAREIARMSGISKSQLYNLCKQDVIEEYYKNQLLKADIDLSNKVQNVDALSTKPLHENQTFNYNLEKNVELLLRLSESQEALIKHLMRRLDDVEGKLTQLYGIKKPPPVPKLSKSHHP